MVTTPLSETKPLLAEYQLASDCLLACKTVWFWEKDSQKQKIALPLNFSDLISKNEAKMRFVELVKQFPERLWPIGILQPDDLKKEEWVDDGVFGSYKKEPPEMYGHLDNIIKDPERDVYIYSGVYYYRFNKNNLGTMNVAFNPKTHEIAAIIESGEHLDEYYIAGSVAIRGSLIAYTVADDLRFAEQSLYYAVSSLKKDHEQLNLLETRPIQFPLKTKVSEAKARIILLNTMLSPTGVATKVPPPPDGIQVAKINQERTWYSVAQGNDKCVVSPMSPADRIDLLHEAGITPNIYEAKNGENLRSVEVSTIDDGYESKWLFWKSKSDCESSITVSDIPDKYR